MIKFKHMVLALALALAGAMSLEVSAQVGPSVAKLAKEFSVSPKLLTKFSKAGLNAKDLRNGLKIAEDVSKVKNLNFDDAAEQVLKLKEGGKDWPDISRDFGIELPKGLELSD
jgi:hypothetical protein